MGFRKDFDLDAWITAWKLGVEQTWNEDKPDEVLALLSISRSLPFTAPEDFQMRAGEAWNVCHFSDPDCPEVRAAVALTYIIASAIENRPSRSALKKRA